MTPLQQRRLARNLDCSFEVLGMASFRRGMQYDPYVLGTCRIQWIEQGRLHWRIGDSERELLPGQMALSLPGMQETQRWSAHETSQAGYIHFACAEPGLDLLRTLDMPLIHHRVAGDDLRIALGRQILDLAERRIEGWRCLALGALRHLVLSLCASPAFGGEQTAELPASLDSMFRNLRRHWQRTGVGKVFIDQLCEWSGCSPSQLDRLCRQHLHSSPVHAIDLVRLDLTILLLRKGFSIKESARSVGYGSERFSTAFRRAFGCSPSHFKLAMRDPTRSWFPDPDPGYAVLHNLLGLYVDSEAWRGPARTLLGR